ALELQARLLEAPELRQQVRGEVGEERVWTEAERALAELWIGRWIAQHVLRQLERVLDSPRDLVRVGERDAERELEPSVAAKPGETQTFQAVLDRRLHVARRAEGARVRRFELRERAGISEPRRQLPSLGEESA